MVKAYPPEFPCDVIAVARARRRTGKSRKTSGSPEACLQRWLRVADRDDGLDPASASTAAAKAALKEAQKRIRLLEQENEILRRAAAYFAQSQLPK